MMFSFSDGSKLKTICPAVGSVFQSVTEKVLQYAVEQIAVGLDGERPFRKLDAYGKPALLEYFARLVFFDDSGNFVDGKHFLLYFQFSLFHFGDVKQIRR